jgi:hypothetical protein
VSSSFLVCECSKEAVAQLLDLHSDVITLAEDILSNKVLPAQAHQLSEAAEGRH